MRDHNIPKSSPPVKPFLQQKLQGLDLGLPESTIPEVLQKPERLKKWSSDLVDIVNSQKSGIFKEWGMASSHLTRADLVRSLDKMKSCGSVVELREPVCRKTGLCGPQVLHAANFCQQPAICPNCAGRIQDRRKAIWKAPIHWASNEYRHAYMITATLPPAATWREHLANMRKAWRAFYLMGQKRQEPLKAASPAGEKGLNSLENDTKMPAQRRKAARSKGEFSKIKAALVKYELKRGDGSGLPHVHLHGLFFTNEYLDFRIYKDKRRGDLTLVCEPVEDKKMSKFSTEWYRASGGTAKNIRADYLSLASAKEKLRYKYGADVDKWDKAEAVFHQAEEVLKYSTKFDSNPDYESDKLFAEDFISIKDATHNRRLFTVYGSFRKDYRKDPAEICPVLDGDSHEYNGGGAHITDRPNIFSARWRDSKYSDLQREFRPVFPGADQTIFNQFQKTLLARLQGKYRRIRTAILKAKDSFVGGNREISPIPYELPVYDSEGNPMFEVVRREMRGDVSYQLKPITRPAVLEYSAAVAANPDDLGAWEAWLNEYTEEGSRSHHQLKESISLDQSAKYAPRTRGPDSYGYFLRQEEMKSPAWGRAERDRITKEFIRVLVNPGLYSALS